MATVKLERNKVVKLFKQLGSATADKWDNKKLAKQLSSLPARLEDDEEAIDELDKKGRKLLEEVAEAVEEENKIVVLGDDDGGEEDAPVKGKKGAKKVAKTKAESNGKAAKKGAKPAKKAVRGSGELSTRTAQGHEMNRLIQKAPTSLDKLVGKTGFSEQRVQSHLNYLSEKNRIKIKKGVITWTGE